MERYTLYGWICYFAFLGGFAVVFSAVRTDS